MLIDTDIQINGLSYVRFRPFISNEVNPDIVFRFRSEKENSFTCFSKSSYVEKTPVSKTIFDFNKNKLHSYYIPAFKPKLEQFRLGPYLISPFLHSFSSAIIHSSAILRNGKVAIFLAPDEGGKTTAIRLAKEGEVLNDDQNIIRKIKNNYYAYGTPWGMISNNLFGPVGAFFILKKAKKLEITRIESNVLLSYLWNEHLSYNFFLPKKHSQQHFNFLADLCKAHPVYEIHFPKSYIDWDEVDNVLLNKKLKKSS